MEPRHTERNDGANGYGEVNVEHLWKVGTLPLEFEYVDDGREFVTDASLESAWLYPHGIGGEGRPLTPAEIEWVDENHPEWVAKMATDEHRPEPEENEVPSCDYFGTLRHI